MMGLFSKKLTLRSRLIYLAVFVSVLTSSSTQAHILVRDPLPLNDHFTPSLAFPLPSLSSAPKNTPYPPSNWSTRFAVNLTSPFHLLHRLNGFLYPLKDLYTAFPERTSHLIRYHKIEGTWHVYNLFALALEMGELTCFPQAYIKSLSEDLQAIGNFSSPTYSEVLNEITQKRVASFCGGLQLINQGLHALSRFLPGRMSTFIEMLAHLGIFFEENLLYQITDQLQFYTTSQSDLGNWREGMKMPPHNFTEFWSGYEAADELLTWTRGFFTKVLILSRISAWWVPFSRLPLRPLNEATNFFLTTSYSVFLTHTTLYQGYSLALTQFMEDDEALVGATALTILTAASFNLPWYTTTIFASLIALL